MSDPQNLLYRMMGGVAGAMDHVDSNTLSRLPTGQLGYMPSRKHLDQVSQMVQSNPQNNQFYFATPKQIMSVQQEEDTMDVSKYLGKNKQVVQKPQPNSQLELLKTALQPISDQLEKICILLGMIYQKLDNEVPEENNYTASTSVPETDNIEDSIDSEEEIAKLEQKLNSHPKPPSLEELGQIKDDLEINL